MKIQLANGEVKELSSVSQAKERQASGKKGYFGKLEERFVETDERIRERGTIQGKLKEQFSGGAGQKALGVLSIMATPLSAIESGISNIGLKIQRKATENPNVPKDQNALLKSLLEAKDLAKEGLKGLGLQKQGQYGDILKNVGTDPTVADATGLFLNIAGASKLISQAGKMFGSISKMSDKGIIKSGNRLIHATSQAKEVVGAKVGEAFAPVADDAVNGIQFLDDVVKLPKAVLKKAEEIFGRMEDFANELSVGRLREFKQFLGKLRPSAYGQAEKGIAETIDVQDLNRVYAATKNLLKETIKNSRGEKVANNLMNLEKSFSEVTRASQYIRKTIVDPTLQKATKGGEAAAKLIKSGDVTLRTALNTIKKSGAAANKSINQAVDLLHSYNRVQLASALVKAAAKAAVFGGAAGAIGGKALQKVTKGKE